MVLYVAATSGTAGRTDVDDMGERAAQNDRIATMMAFLYGGKRSYWSASVSRKSSDSDIVLIIVREVNTKVGRL